MPIKKSNYHPDWRRISTAIKEKAGWTCEACNRPCRRPGETWDEFKYRLARKSKVLYTECCEKKTRFVLTTSHQNHDTSDNREVNLKALCSPCHLRYDAKHHALNAAITRKINKAKKAKKKGKST